MTYDTGEDGSRGDPGPAIRDALQADTLRALYDYWQARRGGRAMPARRDIDPVDIPLLLPHVVLFDVEPAPIRYRVRLIGTHLTEMLGRDDTGCYLDEAYAPAAYARMEAALLGPVTRGTPSHSRAPVYFDSRRDYLDYEAVHLPLSGDGARVDMILSGIRFLPRPRG